MTITSSSSPARPPRDISGATHEMYLVGLFVTLALLKKHVGKLAISEFLAQHIRLLTASLLAMLPLFALTKYISWVAPNMSRGGRAGELLLVMVIAFFGYLLTAMMLMTRIETT